LEMGFTRALCSVCLRLPLRKSCGVPHTRRGPQVDQFRRTCRTKPTRVTLAERKRSRRQLAPRDTPRKSRGWCTTRISTCEFQPEHGSAISESGFGASAGPPPSRMKWRGLKRVEHDRSTSAQHPWYNFEAAAIRCRPP
jgi:hypothetical protein